MSLREIRRFWGNRSVRELAWPAWVCVGDREVPDMDLSQQLQCVGKERHCNGNPTAPATKSGCNTAAAKDSSGDATNSDTGLSALGFLHVQFCIRASSCHSGTTCSFAACASGMASMCRYHGLLRPHIIIPFVLS